MDISTEPSRGAAIGGAASASWSGFLLGLQNLTALVHAGLQVEVMGTAQFAGILVLDIGWLLQCICRAAHATPRRRCFSSGNGHVGVLKGCGRRHRPWRTAEA